MALHVVVGAGATGTATALQLAEAGEQVRLITRRGSGPDHPGIETYAADATDADRLTTLTRGAAVLFNCAMPAYDRWPADWPPLAAALLAAAERTGADYVMLGNAYGYGPVDGPVTEDLPLATTTIKGRVRVRMWTDALAAHDAGRVRVTEVRASDFLGAGAASLYTLTVVPQLLAGVSPIAYPADLDAPHSWTYAADAARTLIAASRSDEAWGHAWHVPSTSDASARELTERLSKVAARDEALLHSMSVDELAELAAHDSILAEVPEMSYLFRRPFVLSTARTERVLGVTPTDLDAVLAETLS
ncbi:NAD-dependent epimerase/dehydratase family protein [Hamadaea tsunoensis]|uniref:NAD-dependent epimerase/dehydratase family protein n=1 Tax=Hamadaea tsunoensis TaxID=53368 RepID=UPI000489379B|nr:NAD-dependent epimerase/dehydratase family protein [Hamadaea tsunoensis]